MKLIRRRSLLQAGIVSIGGAVSLRVGGTLVAFFMDPFRRKRPEQWKRLCRLGDLNSMEPTHFKVVFEFDHLQGTYDDERGVYAILTDKGPLVYTNVCTHMHCSVRWIPWRQEITCPCHGGFYDRWGQLIGGPPPFSLPIYETEVRGDEVWIANRYLVRSYI